MFLSSTLLLEARNNKIIIPFSKYKWPQACQALGLGPKATDVLGQTTHSLYVHKESKCKALWRGWDMMSHGMWKARDDRPGQGGTHGKGWVGQEKGLETIPCVWCFCAVPGSSSNVRSAMPRSRNSSSTFSASMSHTVLPCFILQVLILSTLSPASPESQSCLWNVRQKRKPFTLGKGFS